MLRNHFANNFGNRPFNTRYAIRLLFSHNILRQKLNVCKFGPMKCAVETQTIGYAILRAVVARSLVASGLLPTLGIHHHNRYNAYCLADDIMEPYRPYIDRLVYDITEQYGVDVELSKDIKAELLSIPTLDVVIGGKRSPLMVATTQTTASLYKCFSGELRKITYPEI